MLSRLELRLAMSSARENSKILKARFLIMDKRTNKLELLRESQMIATHEILKGKNIVVCAGTDAGDNCDSPPMLLGPEMKGHL